MWTLVEAIKSLPSRRKSKTKPGPRDCIPPTPHVYLSSLSILVEIPPMTDLDFDSHGTPLVPRPLPSLYPPFHIPQTYMLFKLKLV